MSSILTKAALDALLLSNGCTEAEFLSRRIRTNQGEMSGYFAYSTYMGKPITLGLWGALNQHSPEQVQALIEKKISEEEAS